MLYHHPGQNRYVTSVVYIISKKNRLSFARIIASPPLSAVCSHSLSVSSSSTTTTNYFQPIIRDNISYFNRRYWTNTIDQRGHSHNSLLNRWYSCIANNNNSLVCAYSNKFHNTTTVAVDVSTSITTTNRNSFERRRYYHVTAKQEIIPVILVGAIVVIGVRYSYRAVQRMRHEQEEYYYQLQNYERQQMKHSATTVSADNATTTTTTGTDSISSSSSSSGGPIITMAIDLGTTYMKLSTATYRPLTPITVHVSREGDRSTFNGVLYDDDNDDDTTNDMNEGTERRKVIKATGRGALERYYYPNTMMPDDTTTHNNRKDIVSLPFLEFTTTNEDKSLSSSSLTIVTDVLQSRILEVLDRIHTSTIGSSPTKALIRHIVTVPPLFLHNDMTMKLYQNSFIDCCTKYNNSMNQQPHYDTDSLLVSFIPEPVATLWGAQFSNMLPATLSKDKAMMASYCIIDVGGCTTQISIVQNDQMKHTVAIPWGGESIIEQLVILLKQHNASSGSGSNDSVTLNDSRSLALLQHHARQAVMELSSQSRVSIHVPFLYADPSQHHMDTNMARDVLNQAIENNIQNILRYHQPHSTTPGDQPTSSWLPDTILSPHLPIPNNLTSLWTSILTQALEQSGHLPTTISAVVLVGGGSKYVHVQRTIKDAWNMLTGGVSCDNTDTQFHFDSSASSELTVVGAATLPPSFDYSLSDGLIRR